MEGTRAPRFLSDRRWPPVNETSPLLACSQRPQFEQPGNGIGALGLRDGETVIWIWTPKEQWKKTMIFFDSLCSLINPCRIYIDEILCSIAMGRERENGNENERKRICRSTKLNDICVFLFLGGRISWTGQKSCPDSSNLQNIPRRCQWEQAVHVYRCHMMPLGVQQQLIPNKCSTHILGRRADTDTTYDFVTLLHLISPAFIDRKLMFEPFSFDI